LCNGFDSFYINPNVNFSITDDITLNIGYTFDSSLGAQDNSIQLDFVWKY